MQPPRNPNVPENFFNMYGHKLKQELKAEQRKPNQAELVLAQTITETGMKQFNNSKYTKQMDDLCGIQGYTDEELRKFINDLRSWGNRNQAKEFKRKFGIRQSLGVSWIDRLHEYQSNEATLYRMWCEKMTGMGIENPLINPTLLDRRSETERR